MKDKDAQKHFLKTLEANFSRSSSKKIGKLNDDFTRYERKGVNFSELIKIK